MELRIYGRVEKRVDEVRNPLGETESRGGDVRVI